MMRKRTDQDVDRLHPVRVGVTETRRSSNVSRAHIRNRCEAVSAATHESAHDSRTSPRRHSSGRDVDVSPSQEKERRSTSATRLQCTSAVHLYSRCMKGLHERAEERAKLGGAGQ